MGKGGSKRVKNSKDGSTRVSIPKRLVVFVLDDSENKFCILDPKENKLIKLNEKDATHIESLKKPHETINMFLNTDLPFITYHDLNLFDVFDEDLEKFPLRFYKYSDAILERDVEIPNDLGMKKRPQSQMDCPLDHHYLPGMPNFVFEDYPYFKPHVEESEELTNDDYYNLHLKPFQHLVEKKIKNGSKEVKDFGDYMRNLDVYQIPVDHADYFTFSVYDFKNIFVDRVLGFIVDIYAALFYRDKRSLRKFFDVYDDEYSPEIKKDCFTSLKPIGSCAESPYAWGIFDKETSLLNKLWVHVEFVNICSGIAEGYELVFGTKKKNFQDDKITGSDFTKRNNFLKRFTKCVSICLNSKTRRFIMTDYYWIGCFEIQDVFDGEIEDAKRFISKVKVRHFAYHNFESDERLTIRNIVASFFFMTPEKSTADVEALDIINQRVVDEWTSFQKCTSPILGQHQRKRMKHSPFVYRTHTGLSFTKQHVDLEKSLLRFIAIGTTWSCQTLLVDLKKLYQDKSYLSGLNFKGKKEVLLSVYDEYYQDPSLSMVMRHLKNTSLKHGSTKLVSNAQDVFNNWLSNVEAYLRLKPLQGDILARMVDYGYLEDKKHNGQDTHLKCDGYYIVYEPLCAEWEDLEPIDINNDEHFELAKQALKRIHQLGVTFAPSTSLTKDILKVYGGKVRVVNLEAVNTTGVSQYYMNKDNMMLEREFKRANASSSSTSKKVSYPAGMIYGDELSDDEGDEDDGDEDDDSVLSSSEILY
ncbi:CYFA0S15e00892g1_1 [Cyberlindnera fabianii]|uniref:CYFA0S15e00892g1_1 n=1 Tax=Cyberlindnera fabianii TaxID=36022 RepID=A0A061B3Z2_CYBFA|nr:CYFA0S15e00892g1_1 [Cyberlindnera fabianii]